MDHIISFRDAELPVTCLEELEMILDAIVKVPTIGNPDNYYERLLDFRVNQANMRQIGVGGFYPDLVYNIADLYLRENGSAVVDISNRGNSVIGNVQKLIPGRRPRSDNYVVRLNIDSLQLKQVNEITRMTMDVCGYRIFRKNDFNERKTHITINGDFRFLFIGAAFLTEDGPKTFFTCEYDFNQGEILNKQNIAELRGYKQPRQQSSKSSIN